MEAISDLPMLNDMDADYSPQYVKLARILRAKIESGQYQHGTSYLLPTWRGNMRSPCGWLPRAGDARRQQIRLPSGQFRVLPGDAAGGGVMAGRRPRCFEIPKAQAAVVGANIRVLRQRNGWP